jgi:hypothetical protein
MPTIAELFQPHHRYIRSTHLERDFTDPTALEGYVLTEQTKPILERLSRGLATTSTRRAWRITGDYGSGKSSFALFLSHLFASNRNTIPQSLQNVVDFEALGIDAPQLLPVLITGSREPLSVALLRGLRDALKTTDKRKKQRKAFSDTIQSYLDQAFDSTVTGEQLVTLIQEITTYITQQKTHSGMLIILDELGKFLEFAALYPEHQDAYLLQQLAEMASRSGKKPILILGLLHQGLSAYTNQLSQLKEWEKVAGRFEEILFDQSPEQMITLVADALRIQLDDNFPRLAEQAQQAMRETLLLEPRWYGAAIPSHTLIAAAAQIYPLHPTVMPVLIRLFKRFGQNERSLFSFLFSNEPCGLQSFAQQPVAQGTFYRLHHLYDYARAVFGHTLSIQSYRSHWNVIDALIQSFHTDDQCALYVLKTVGLLNLLNSTDLLPTEEAVLLAVNDENDFPEEHVRTVLQQLHRERHILYYRGTAGGFCLWPYTSVNLETAFEQSEKAIPQVERVGVLLPHYINAHPIVARRHYIETGNLRHFEIKYVAPDRIESSLQASSSADGVILIALCETEEERRQMVAFATSDQLRDYPTILVAVSPALTAMASLIHNLQRWQWVEKNTRGLINDAHAAEEVTRQITAAKITLEKRLQELIGFQASVSTMQLQWFYRGKREQEITNGRRLFSTLSDLCDEVYHQAPRILNELVNRQTISSAATAARRRLIEGVLEHPFEPFIGLNTSKNPPEMAMYRSVLQKSGLHREIQGIPAIAEPDHDICSVLPTLNHIQEILTRVPDQRVAVTDIFTALRKPPYGVRDGLIPVLLAVFFTLHEHHIALYEDGRFLIRVVEFDFLRLIKAPHTFEMQYCTVAGVRSVLFQHLLTILELTHDQHEQGDILNVVRPLCEFAAQLPPYTHKTGQLREVTKSVRNTLLKVSEPAPMIFLHLPVACGVDGFGPEDETDEERIHRFVMVLKEALDELKDAYRNLQQRIYLALVDTFNLQGTAQDVRQELETRIRHILPAVHEPRLKAFCLRLADHHLSETAWIDSVGSIVCSRPPRQWSDEDEQIYYEKLAHLCSIFHRVESIAFATPGFLPDNSAFRVAVTQSDGTEVDRILYINENETEQTEELVSQIRALMQQNERIGLVAASRAVWQALAEEPGD